jgi:hypothetical protein
MFAGRPVLWKEDRDADGAGLLDVATFSQDVGSWDARIDGRCAVVQYDGETLSVVTDPLGSYPVYSTDSQGTRWLGNNVELLRRLRRQKSDEMDVFALAAFVGCGYALGERSIHAGITRVPRGASLRYADGQWTQRDTFPDERIGEMFSVEGSSRDASQVLTSVTRALGDWAGRPVFVSVTGGRDSRLVFAAALEAGIPFQARTIADPAQEGYPMTSEVRVAANLCELVGIPHVVQPREPASDVDARLRVFRLISPGTVAFNELGRIETASSIDPVEIDLGGQGGELARLFYGDATSAASDEEVARALEVRLLKRWPPTLLNAVGRRLISDYLGTWVAARRGGGIDRRDLPDAFYLLERLSNWAGQIGAVGEYWRDAASPLWTAGLLPFQFGASLEDRAHDRFHLKVMEVLRPDLVHVPFGGASPSWNSSRLMSLAHKASAELARRTLGRVGLGGREVPTGDFILIHQLAREIGALPPDDSCWQVLDRRRTLRLLRRNPLALPPRERNQVYRLASALVVAKAPAP